MRIKTENKEKKRRGRQELICPSTLAHGYVRGIEGFVHRQILFYLHFDIIRLGVFHSTEASLECNLVPGNIYVCNFHVCIDISKFVYPFFSFLFIDSGGIYVYA